MVSLTHVDILSMTANEINGIASVCRGDIARYSSSLNSRDQELVSDARRILAMI